RATAPEHLTFGLSLEADVRLLERTPGIGGKTELLFHLGERLKKDEREAQVRVTTSLLGSAAAVNVAAALCGALALLGRPASGAELQAVAAALGAVEAVDGRLKPRTIGKILVLDDSYNSNPKSVPPALAAAREVAELRDARFVVALGDMLELGSRAGQEHQEMVALAANSGAALLILVGEESGRALGQSSFSTPFHWYPDSAAAAAALPGLVAPGDVVLVKGSRGVRMERLIESLA
ncbi:MAG: glutamate ligase domain-containing protein, partial [Myxococcota bacterium]